MEPKRKYEFSWDLLGNIELGRPNLGHNTGYERYNAVGAKDSRGWKRHRKAKAEGDKLVTVGLLKKWRGTPAKMAPLCRAALSPRITSAFLGHDEARLSNRGLFQHPRCPQSLEAILS